MNLIGIACALLVSGAPERGDTVGDRYRAWLEVPAGQLPFEIVIDGERATLVNGEERDDAPRVVREGDRLTIEMDYFGSRIEARVEGDRLEGEWCKTRSGGRVASVPFHARRGDGPRFEPLVFVRPDDTPPLTGRWLVHFESSEDPAVGVFTVGESGEATGTFLTTTGDYRYLAGRQDGARLRLSCFDGAHAFLFDAHADEHGRLRGTFSSGDWWQESWTAERAPEAALADGWTQTTWDCVADLGALRYPDLEGVEHAVSEYLGERGMVVKIFGSWCPNCRDAARHMAELHAEFGGSGVGFLGLAFELTGDLERDGEQVRAFAGQTGIAYPVLVAGLSDKAAASGAVPVLDRVRSFPTTMFVNADGEIVAVHTGYSGPATGEAHARLRQEFDERIRAMIE